VIDFLTFLCFKEAMLLFKVQEKHRLAQMLNLFSTLFIKWKLL